jgi:peptide/nickel transport system permease protein
MPILGFIGARIGVALFTMFVVSLIVFIAMHLLPGGFEQIILGPIQTQATRDAITNEFGLDAPIAEQFVKWAIAVLHGDFGVSMITRTPVAAELVRRAPATLQLAAMSIFTTLVVGLPLGIASGIGDTRRSVRVGARLLGALGASTPDFVLGTILVYVFSVWALGLTVGGYAPFLENPIANLRAMALPTLTLSVPGIALVLRTTRESVLNVMTSGHITTAVSRGESPSQIVRRHILRNASLPILTVTTMYLGALMGGSVIVETLFTIPGIGLYTWNALNNRDYQVTESAVLIFSILLVAVNMCVDIAYALLDPRIQGRRS